MPLTDRVATPWKLVALGIAAGIIGGGLGIGGGLIMVPLLAVLGFDRHRAHATSLVAVLCVAIAGAVGFGASGEVDLYLGILVGIGGIGGSIFGATVMNKTSPRRLQLIFAILLVVVGIRMVLGVAFEPDAAGFDGVLEALIALLLGAATGFIAGMMGIGGGIIIVPALVFLLGLGQHEAQGTSLVAVIFASASGTLVNLRNERVRLKDGLVLGAGGAAGALIGSRAALGVESRTLMLVFGVLVLFVASRSLYQAVRPGDQDS